MIQNTNAISKTSQKTSLPTEVKVAIAPTAITQALGLTHWNITACQKVKGLFLLPFLPKLLNVAILYARDLGLNFREAS